jgi:hypothetical protein
MSKLSELCEEIYVREGRDGVVDFIVQNYPTLPWDYCDSCDDNSPCQDNVCLVCSEYVVYSYDDKLDEF